MPSTWFSCRPILLTLLSVAAAASAAADCTPVESLPVEITAPGAYCLTGDLSYDGEDAAITVAADDVDLDLRGFRLAGPGDPARTSAAVVGVYRSGMRVRNGRIEGFRIGVVHAGPPAVGPVMEDLSLDSIHYIGIFAEGPGATVHRCRVARVGGSTVPGDTIPVGIFVYGNGASIAYSVVTDVTRPDGPGSEAIGIALGNAVPSAIHDNVIVNREPVPNTWAIWLANPNDTAVSGNFIAGYNVGVAFPTDTKGTVTGNTFMNVNSTYPPPDAPYAEVVDGGGNRSFRAACQPVFELPWTITEPGRYCLVRNLSTPQVSGSAIEIASDDVVLEMGGFKVGGGSAGPATETSGVHAVDRRNLTVRGGNIRGFRRAVFLEETVPGASHGHVVERVLADSNTDAGIHVGGDNAIVRRNQVVNVGGAASPGPDAAAIRVEGAMPRVSGNDVASPDSLGGARPVGIHVVEGTGAVVESNRVSLDPAAPSVAILLEGSADAVAISNRVVRAAEGIVYDASTGKYGRNLTVGVAAPFSGGTDIGGNN